MFVKIILMNSLNNNNIKGNNEEKNIINNYNY